MFLKANQNPILSAQTSPAIPAETIKPKAHAIRGHIELMMCRAWAKPGALTGRTAQTVKNFNQYQADLLELWRLTEGMNTADEIERKAWAEAIRNDSPAFDLENHTTHKPRPKVFNRFLFECCQTLNPELLDFAWRFELWYWQPIKDTGQTCQRIKTRASLQNARPMWEQIEAPKYPQSAEIADATWKRLQAGIINPIKAKQRNDEGAELIRAAAFFWQLIEPMKAAALFRALHNPELAPSEKVAELLGAALKTFNHVPTTARAIQNYLRA